MQSSLRRLLRTRLPYATARRLRVSPTARSNPRLARNERAFSALTPRRQAASVAEPRNSSHLSHKLLIGALPLSCPGCGAPSQTVAPDLAGYYSTDMNHVKAYLKRDQEPSQPQKREDNIYAEAVANLDPSIREQLGVTESPNPLPKPTPPPPLCNRCHRLVNHREGVPIDHPSIYAIRAMIRESPHKRNCIYHVADAADFPMSVIPDITRALDVAPLRSRTRGAAKAKWHDGRHSHVEFVITRADLLVPQEDMANKLMPYMVDVLREKIGREYKENIRLSNVHLVSAQRGWWTSAIKQNILHRGGASWFVGKANVGKSSLFEVVFPKGKKDYVDVEQLRDQAQKQKRASSDSPKPAPEGRESKDDVNPFPKENEKHVEERSSESSQEDLMTQAGKQALETLEDEAKLEKETKDAGGETAVEKDFDAQSIEKYTQEHADTEAPPEESPEAVSEEATQESVDLKEPLAADQHDSFSEMSLLPPPRKEVDYPTMPIISHLPGTTASPIRIPFARGRGELIDLPGLDRGGMDQYVAAQHRSKLLLKSRKKTERIVVKPNESLVLGGGLVRITPATADLVYLVYPFVELPWHKSSTDKAVARERGELENARSGVVNWADDSARGQIRSAGVVPLKYDVTKKAAGTLLRKDVTRLKAYDLPFVVWAVDILIEGLGWVEVTAQTRRSKKHKIYATTEADAELKRGRTQQQGDEGKEMQQQEAETTMDNVNTDKGSSSAQPQTETATDNVNTDEDSSFSPQTQPDTTTTTSPESVNHENTSSAIAPSPNTMDSADAAADDALVVCFPQIHVFSPYGRCIGTRQPLMGSVLNAPPSVRTKQRPRLSMKAVKARRPKGTAPGVAPDTVARGVRRR